jgi:hypothetical protein
MRLVYKKRAIGQLDFGLLYGGIALLALSAARFFPILPFFPSCPLHELTGFPCPTCGSSRSIVQLAQGNFLASLTLNPLTALCVTAAILYFCYSFVVALFFFPKLDIQLAENEKDVVRFGLIFLVLINWFYLAVYL